MRLWIAAVGTKPRAGFDELTRMYLKRIAAYLPGGGKGSLEAIVFRSEGALWGAIERERARTAPLVVLLDERGKQMSSQAFAHWLGQERNAGRQLVIFAVGPADGWDQPGTGTRQPATQKGADVMWLSLGPMTMAHELARVVIAEQVYRALTILAGHPYHRGSQ